jgi:glyoxylase I family protein
MIEYLEIAHASVIVADTERALRFYRDVLGLRVLPERPDLGYPGAWLAVGGQQIHLLQLPNPDVQDAQVPRAQGRAGAADPVTGRPAHGGRDRHVAIHVRELAPLRAALDRAGVAYTPSRSGRAALFARDPDGNALEFIEAGKTKTGP